MSICHEDKERRLSGWTTEEEGGEEAGIKHIHQGNEANEKRASGENKFTCEIGAFFFEEDLASFSLPYVYLCCLGISMHFSVHAFSCSSERKHASAGNAHKSSGSLRGLDKTDSHVKSSGTNLILRKAAISALS